MRKESGSIAMRFSQCSKQAENIIVSGYRCIRFYTIIKAGVGKIVERRWIDKSTLKHSIPSDQMF